MELISSSAGRDHLAERSRLKLRLAALPPVKSVVVVEDSEFDAAVLSSSLRLILGAKVRIRHARQLAEMSKALSETMPDLLFLDDRLSHSVSAEQSLTRLRAAGYKRPVIIMSGLLTRARSIELARLGVADIVHKDDINAARLAEAVLKVLDNIKS